MPDPNTGDVVARASLEVPDPSFDVVLRRGDHHAHVFFRWEESEQMWTDVVGTTEPAKDGEELHQKLNDMIDAAVGGELGDSRRYSEGLKPGRVSINGHGVAASIYVEGIPSTQRLDF